MNFPQDRPTDRQVRDILNYLATKETLMHYRNGREAKNGDKVVQLSYEGGRINGVGVLHSAVAGNDHCNGGVAPLTSGESCLADMLHMDDLAAILAEKGLDKRPAGK